MNRLSPLLSTLNIRPGEGKLVALMLLYAFFMGIPALVTETTAYTLFLVEFSAQAIPYIYIGFTIVTTLSGFLYTKLEKRISFFRFATLNLLLLMLSLIGFRVLLWTTDAGWPAIVLAIWYESSWALSNLAFWSVAAHLFNVRQGKRLFSLIGIGLTLSETVIGFFIPFLVRSMGTPNLILVASASFGGALLVQTYILRTYSTAQPASSEAEEEKEGETNSFTDLIKNHYIVAIFGLAAFYALSFYALDIAFYDRVEARYLNPDQLASFLGVFFAITGIVTMLVGAFVSGHLIYRRGVRFGLLIMPITLLVGVAAIAITGTFFQAVTLLFWLVAITRFFNEVLAYTINRAAWQVLYEPLPPSQRLRAQTVVESMIKPTAGGLAGVILLVLGSIVAFEAVQVAYFLLIILGIWIGIVLLLGRIYPKMLLKMLAKRRLGSGHHFTADSSSITALKQGLSSPHVGVVTYSLNMLEEIEPESLPTFLQNLLAHPEASIRRDALRRIERFEVTEALPAVKQRIEQDPSPAVRGIALRTLITLGGAEATQEIDHYLEHPDRQIRLGALVGLLRNWQNNSNGSSIKKKLEELVQSPQVEARQLAAQAVGEAGAANFHTCLPPLLQDDHPAVKRSALNAAGKLKHPLIWPVVIEQLASPAVRTTAATALVAGGSPTLPHIEQALNRPDQPREVLNRLVQVCGRIKGPQATTLLKKLLDFPDIQVRTHILQALSLCGYSATEAEKAVMQQKIREELAQVTQLLALVVQFNHTKEANGLVQALHRALQRHRTHIFLWLSFIHNSESILRVRDAFDQNGSAPEPLATQKKAYALEIIDVLASPQLKPLLIPLLDDLTPDQRLQALQPYFPQPPLDRSEQLHHLITASPHWIDPWTKACALYTIARLSMVELVDAVTETLQKPDPLLRETALWSLHTLAPALFNRYAAPLLGDQHLQVARAARWLATDPPENKTMLSLVERIMLLKAVSFFSETPEDVLTEVAYLLDEVEIAPEQLIIEKGEPGSSLYIIIDGLVRVHDGAQHIRNLGERDVFGELSLLDPAPRSASVTAVKRTRLLRLDQEPFNELIDDHSRVARRIMQILVRSLRQAQAQVIDSPADGLLKTIPAESSEFDL